MREELELDRLVHKDVVGCHTGLTGVAEPAPGDPPGGDLEGCVAVDQARRLAAELEDDRGEVLGGLLEHDLADVAAPREEDQVESFVQERLGLLGAPLDHRDGLRVEVARHQVSHQGRSVGRDFRRLQDRRIAAGQRTHQGRQEQVDGIVPGADDEHHAEGVVGRPGSAGLGQERRVLPLWPHPPVEVLERVVDLADHEADLGEIRLEPGLAEIGPERLADSRLLLLQERLQGLELRTAPGAGASPPAAEARPRLRHLFHDPRSRSLSLSLPLPTPPFLELENVYFAFALTTTVPLMVLPCTLQ